LPIPDPTRRTLPTKTSAARALAALSLLAALAVPAVVPTVTGCTTLYHVGSGRMRERAPSSEIEADGEFVRHLRLRLAPSHTKRFEALLEECVAAARAARLDGTHGWMTYREPPGRYWIVTIADAEEEFPLPADLHGFVGSILASAAESERAAADARAEGEAALDGLEIEVEWNLLLRTKSEWSTVEAMSTATHPKAHWIDRTIRPGMEAEFDRALAARTAFFAKRDYPLPVEGFVVRAGAPGRAVQVVFPVDWPTFHGATSFFEFSKTLDEAGRQEYADRKADLLRTMSRAEYHDASFVSELSYAVE